jgi:hypothetical protein
VRAEIKDFYINAKKQEKKDKLMMRRRLLIYTIPVTERNVAANGICLYNLVSDVAKSHCCVMPFILISTSLIIYSKKFSCAHLYYFIIQQQKTAIPSSTQSLATKDDSMPARNNDDVNVDI